MSKEKTRDIFTVEEVNTFISFLDDNIDKNIAKLIFIDKLTNEQIADIIGYSKRHVERRRFNLFVTVVKKLIKLHTVNTGNTHFNAQINNKDGKYSIQFETDQHDLYKQVEKACQFAVDTATVRKSEMKGDNL